MSEANLFGANLRAANLVEADITLATLDGTDLDGADFTEAKMGLTKFAAVNLAAVKGLETIRHAAPSRISVNTLYQSRGDIPVQFLRGAGIPGDFIAYIRSLVGTAFKYYSCFLSHSSKDQELVERLHADLQSKGVGCWYAPEDLKIGDPIRQRVDEAIRVQDKLLIVLSENSVTSSWVEKEVETAFEKERRANRIVLFPIRLDDAIMKTDEAWAADIRRTRHIGDFCDWKDADSYKKALDRLLRDLKAEAKP